MGETDHQDDLQTADITAEHAHHDRETDYKSNCGLYKKSRARIWY